MRFSTLDSLVASRLVSPRLVTFRATIVFAALQQQRAPKVFSARVSELD